MFFSPHFPLDEAYRLAAYFDELSAYLEKANRQSDDADLYLDDDNDWDGTTPIDDLA